MMRKTRFLLVLICISTVLFSAGCGAQKTSTVPLKEIINLSESDISSIGTSEGSGLQTTIQDSTQIKSICNFLSQIDLKSDYQKEEEQEDSSGGGGAYFLIRYSDDKLTHLQIYVENNQARISGDIKGGQIENGWKVYTLSDSSQITKLSDMLAIK